MKIVKGRLRKKGVGKAWSRHDLKLFRLNLAIYQNHPGEPAQPAAHMHHRKAS